MVLPPVEKTPVIVIRFTVKTSDRLVDLVEERLRAGGLISLERADRLLRLTATQQLLEETAEMIHLMKRTNDTKIIDNFTVRDRLRFCQNTKPDDQLTESSPTVLNLDEHGLFTSNEWALLIYRILGDITVLQPAEILSELSCILDETYHADYHVHRYDASKWDNVFNNKRSMTASFKRTLQKHGEQSVCLLHVLRAYDIVDVVTLVHSPKIRQEVLNKTFWPWYQLMPPVHDIQNYYGWEISFYFAWMGFQTQWLFFPGIFGLLVLGLRWYFQVTLDEDKCTPFYGLVTFLWSVLFLRFWQRHEHRLAYQWGTYSLSLYDRQKHFAVRPEFCGYLRKSPVTGKVETFYSPIRRRFKYIVSAIITSAMLLVAFAVMILSLNLQGYIHPKSNPKRWNDVNTHPFHVRTLAVLAEEGRHFDEKSSWRSLIPVVLHVICIFTLNNIYRVVAGALTSWENHETELSHRNSLVLKRFLFEAFDCYVALFYLAFYERDVDRLRMELIAVFQIDTLRRVLLECIIPMILQRGVTKLSHTQEPAGFLRKVPSGESIAPTEYTLLEDLEKAEYEQFDDYMEIVIQLGYVTLFASAYPLASLISIAANWVEIRADCFKLTNVCRRPGSFRTSGLGMWRTLMASVIWMSALTNCLIAGFTSGQLTHYLPDFYIREDDGYTIDAEDGWVVAFVIFGLERLLLLAGLLIFAVVPEIPNDVAIELERRHYVHSQQRALTVVTFDKKKD